MITRRKVFGIAAVPLAAAIPEQVNTKSKLFDVERRTVKAASRSLRAEYTLDFSEKPMIYVSNRSIKQVDDILRENEPKAVRIRTEDGIVLWEKYK